MDLSKKAGAPTVVDEQLIPPAVQQARDEAIAALNRAYSKLSDLWTECADRNINVGYIDELANGVREIKQRLDKMPFKKWDPDDRSQTPSKTGY